MVGPERPVWTNLAVTAIEVQARLLELVQQKEERIAELEVLVSKGAARVAELESGLEGRMAVSRGRAAVIGVALREVHAGEVQAGDGRAGRLPAAVLTTTDWRAAGAGASDGHRDGISDCISNGAGTLPAR